MAALAVVFAIALARPASAYDPATTWRTLVSPHFEVHYPTGYYDTGLAVARAAESALVELSDRLGWMPAVPVHIVVSDETDWANGFARVVPYNLIGLNAVAPEEVSDLSHYDDYVYDLVAHELTHIIHIDTVFGASRIVNKIFGKLLTPNGAQAPWFVEGIATYYESALTHAGRIRSPYFKMILRMAVLEDVALDLGQMSGFPFAWPQGSVRYLYGGHFLDYMVRRFGEEVLRAISYDYGGRFIPFAMNASVESVTGLTYPEIYDDFLAELRREYGAQRDAINALGRREGTRLTERGQEIGPPRAARDGTIYFVESAVGEHAVLKAMAPNRSERTIGRVLSGAQLALHPDGLHAVVAQVEVHDVYRRYGDLFLLDLADGSSQQISYGARARDPDVDASGERVVLAQNDGTHSVIRSALLSDPTSIETLADLGPGTQVWSPRYAPDGNSVVFAGFRDGRRDIYRVDIGSRAISRLTADQATDGAPVFSPDGAWVYFHSDRDGVFNLYAVPSSGGAIHRLTRVLGGAFQPEPSADGEAIIYRTYGITGFDLARLSLDDATAWPVWTAKNEAPPATIRQRAEVYPARSYGVASTILPRIWMPLLSLDARGSTYGAGFFGEDAVGLHAYAASAWYGATSGFTGFSLWYVNRQFHPGLFVTLDRRLGFAMLPYVRNGRAVGVEEEIMSGRIGASWPLLSHRESSLWLSTIYEMTIRQGTRPLQIEPLDRTPRFPDQGRFGALRLRLSYGNLRSYIGSISTEEGTRLEVALRVEDPFTGSEYSAVSGSLALTQFLRVPHHPRHVLAADLSFSYGKSNYRHRKLFGIGGLPRRDLVLEILAGRFGSGQALRGFPQTPFFIGDALAVGHLEYRMPLVDVEAGVQTLPIYFRTLHAALFVDGAAIADTASDLRGNQHYSIGAELRMGMVLGYGLPVTARLGWGHGLGKDDVHAVFLVFGNSF